MPRLSRAQQHAYSRLRQVAERPLLPEQLGLLLLDTLQHAIGSDIQVLLGVDHASLLFNRLLALHESRQGSYLHWLETTYLVNEPVFGVTFPGMMRSRVP